MIAKQTGGSHDRACRSQARSLHANIPDTDGSCGEMLPELDREGDDVDDVDLVGDTGSEVAPRLPALARFVGVLGSLSIGIAGAKALLCTWQQCSAHVASMIDTQLSCDPQDNWSWVMLNRL